MWLDVNIPSTKSVYFGDGNFIEICFCHNGFRLKRDYCDKVYSKYISKIHQQFYQELYVFRFKLEKKLN